jgi:hypothetical protein
LELQLEVRDDADPVAGVLLRVRNGVEVQVAGPPAAARVRVEAPLAGRGHRVEAQVGERGRSTAVGGRGRRARARADGRRLCGVEGGPAQPGPTGGELATSMPVMRTSRVHWRCGGRQVGDGILGGVAGDEIRR